MASAIGTGPIQVEVKRLLKDGSPAAAAPAPSSKPFGPYADFASCVAANADKDDPKAYCATIESAITGKDTSSLDTHMVASRGLGCPATIMAPPATT